MHIPYFGPLCMHVGIQKSIILYLYICKYSSEGYETKYVLNVVEEYTECTDDLKESIIFYGPYKLAETLHSLNIIRFYKLPKLQELSNIHLASVIVDQLSQDIKERKKYLAFLNFLKREPSLSYIYYKMSFLSKSKYTSLHENVTIYFNNLCMLNIDVISCDFL